MYNDNVDLRDLVEELNSEVFEDDENQLSLLTYTSDGFVQVVSIPENRILDDDNCDNCDDEEKLGIQKTLECILEETLKMEKALSILNNILKRKLEVYSSNKDSEEEPEIDFGREEYMREGNELLKEMGETDLNKIGEFDNRRFD